MCLETLMQAKDESAHFQKKFALFFYLYKYTYLVTNVLRTKTCFKLVALPLVKRVARQRPGSLGFNIIWASTRKILTLLHLPSLISVFIIHNWNSKVTRSDISKFSNFFGGFQHDRDSGYAPALST